MSLSKSDNVKQEYIGRLDSQEFLCEPVEAYGVRLYEFYRADMREFVRVYVLGTPIEDTYGFTNWYVGVVLHDDLTIKKILLYETLQELQEHLPATQLKKNRRTWLGVFLP